MQPAPMTHEYGDAVKIAALEVYPVSRTVRPEWAIVSAAGAQPESHFVMVAVRTEDGLTGWGEASVVACWSGETQATALTMIRDVFAPLLVGRDALHVRALADLMDRQVIGNPFTKSSIEMALLDLAGKRLGLPTHVLLGGPLRAAQIPLRFSIGGFPAARAASVARSAYEAGCRAFKVKVALGLEADIARVEAVREALGNQVRVAVDANGGWLENDAVAILPHLERLGVNCIEQPYRRGEYRACARLRQRTAIPLMLDESVFTREQAYEAIRADACDIISIYPGKNGGILRSLDIAQMAATAGLRSTIGSNLEMDVSTAAMLHVAVAAPNLAENVDHDIIGPLYYERPASCTPVQFENGCAVVPDGPGLGIEFDPALA